jgi:hypothetical protein
VVPGSSTIRIASERLFEGLRIRLVAFVFREIVKLTCGMLTPALVGTPPVQSRIISPISSVKPSALSVMGTAAMTSQLNGGGATWAVRGRVNSAKRGAIAGRIRIFIEALLL